MKIGIVGGALQGMEAVYLSRKAGYETFVIDRKEAAPACSLADGHAIMDVVKDREKAVKALSDCDAVIPACEELDALNVLCGMFKGSDIPFLFDIDAYTVSCSKERSNAVMFDLGVPMPEPWPACGFPAVVKPSSQSGSIGVSVVDDEAGMKKALKVVDDLHDVPIVQEFVSGKSVSIEAIGNGRESRSYVTTEVILDSNYDCKRVVCEPDILPPADNEIFGRIGTKIADSIGLKALMDVEAIYTKKGLRVLEIDARIPSQTPAAIEAATGINLMEELVCSATGRRSNATNRGECSSYEHYLIQDSSLISCGEKVFGAVDKPYFASNLFGEDDIITDYQPGKNVWRATVINSGKTSVDVLWKRKDFIKNVMDECDLEEYIDRSPEMV